MTTSLVLLIKLGNLNKYGKESPILWSWLLGTHNAEFVKFLSDILVHCKVNNHDNETECNETKDDVSCDDLDIEVSDGSGGARCQLRHC